MNTMRQHELKKYLIAGAIVLAIAVLTVIIGFTVKAYASEEYYDVKIGNETVAVLTSEASAKQVIRDVQNHYVMKGAEVKSIQTSPAMSVEKKNYQVSNPPKVSTVKTAADYILSGTKAKKTYTVKSGDSLWKIAENHGFTVREIVKMNEDKDFATLFPGDKIKLYEMKPMVDVTVTQKVTAEKQIKYKTVTKTSSEVPKSTTIVEQKGIFGSKTVTELVTSKNGEVTDREELSSKVTKEPRNKIVVKGTGTVDVSGGATYPGDGSAIASYALQFVGNPYVYGGTSLTEGADCSGFIYRVYGDCGYNIPRVGHGGLGRSVSLAEAQPGDIIIYSGHVSLYIGGGQEVHAVNERLGIAVTGVGYVGPVLDIRRVVE